MEKRAFMSVETLAVLLQRNLLPNLRVFYLTSAGLEMLCSWHRGRDKEKLPI